MLGQTSGSWRKLECGILRSFASPGAMAVAWTQDGARAADGAPMLGQTSGRWLVCIRGPARSNCSCAHRVGGQFLERGHVCGYLGLLFGVGVVGTKPSSRARATSSWSSTASSTTMLGDRFAVGLLKRAVEDDYGHAMGMQEQAMLARVQGANAECTCSISGTRTRVSTPLLRWQGQQFAPTRLGRAHGGLAAAGWEVASCGVDHGALGTPHDGVRTTSLASSFWRR